MGKNALCICTLLLRLTLTLALALLLTRNFTSAQVLYGTLTGSVSDPTQAAVPGAKVTVVNAGTGLTRETTTNQEGMYLFSDLPPGVYKVTASGRSFAPAVRDGVGIEANRTR